jgi:hypothetical protein
MEREVVGEIQRCEMDLSPCESTNWEEVAYRSRKMTIEFQTRPISQD